MVYTIMYVMLYNRWSDTTQNFSITNFV